MPETDPIRVLFLAANPKDTTPLRLETEVRTIDRRLRAAKFHQRFELLQVWALQEPDLTEALLRYQPHIVHFSGHGNPGGQILLEDAAGMAQAVSTQAISTLFGILSDNIRCVVLNACFSEAQAKGIVQHIDCVVGMSSVVIDRSSLAFAAGFYQALAWGRSVQTSFQLGCNEIDLASLYGSDTPKLWARTGVNPAEVFLVEPTLCAKPRLPVAELPPSTAAPVSLPAFSSVLTQASRSSKAELESCVRTSSQLAAEYKSQIQQSDDANARQRWMHQRDELAQRMRQYLESYLALASVMNYALPEDLAELVAHFDGPPVDRKLPVDALAEQVKAWLRLKDYTFISRRRVDDSTVDWLTECQVQVHARTLYFKTLLRCVDGEADLPKLQALQQALAEQNISDGWLIAERRVAPSARQAAEQPETLLVSTLDEVVGMVFDPLPYFCWLEREVAQQELPRYYEDLGCEKLILDADGQEIARDVYFPVDTYIDVWLGEQCKNHLSLLGEFGSGKTWFCLNYAQRQLERYRADPVNQRIPLYIPLREYAQVRDVRQLITDLLVNRYQINLHGGFEAFDLLNRSGRLLLILDGFDEMTSKVNYRTVVDNFWRLAELVAPKSKLLLTCRREFFRYEQEATELLGGRQVRDDVIDLTAKPHFEVLNLTSLAQEQIEQFVARRVPQPELLPTLQKIFRSPRLRELAGRPLLLTFLLLTLPDVGSDERVSLARLFQLTVEALLRRNIAEGRAWRTVTAEKIALLAKLGWVMIKSGELRIHFTKIPEYVSTWLGASAAAEDVEYWTYELRNQTLLVRDEAGYYEFVHRSMAEYFAARYLLAEIRRGGDFDAAGYMIFERGVLGFIRESLTEADVALLLRLLRNSRNKWSQVFAAFFLGRLGEASVLPAFQDLYAAPDTAEVVRREVAFSATYYGVEGLVEDYVAHLERDPEANAAHLTTHTAYHTSVEAALKHAVDYLTRAKNFHKRILYISYLAWYGDRRHIPSLEKFVDDVSPFVRTKAAEAIQKMNLRLEHAEALQALQLRVKGPVVLPREGRTLHCPHCWSADMLTYVEAGKEFYRCAACGYAGARMFAFDAKDRYQIYHDGLLIHYSVGAIISRQGQYLLLARRKFPFQWTLVAGHWDTTDATPQIAMARELREESGLVGEVGAPVCEELLLDPCRRGADLHFWKLFVIEVPQGEVRVNEEAHQARWFAPEELAALDMTVPSRYFMEKLGLIK